MKLKYFLLIVLSVLISFSVTACSGSPETEAKKETKAKEQTTTLTDSKKDTTTKTSKKDDSSDVEFIEISFKASDTTVETVKATAKNSLKTKFDQVQVKYDADDEILLSISNVYIDVLSKVDSLTGSVDEVKNKLNEYYSYLDRAIKIYEQTITTIQTLKEQVIKEATYLYNKVTNTVNKDKVKTYYDAFIKEVNDAKDSIDVKKLYKEYSEVLLKYATDSAIEALENTLNTLKGNLDTLCNDYINKITDDEIKNSVKKLYNSYKLKLESIVALDENDLKAKAKEVITEFKAEAFKYVKDKIELTVAEYKEVLLTELDTLYAKGTALISNEDVKTYLDKYYKNQKDAINKLNNVADAKAMLLNMADEGKNVAKAIAIEYVKDAKQALIDKVDELLTELINKIEDTNLQARLTTLKTNTLAEIEKINSVDDVKPKSTTILANTKTELASIALEQVTIYKNLALDLLDEKILSLIDQIEDTTLKNQVTTFYNNEKKKINDITDLDSAKTIGATVLKDSEDFIKEVGAQLLTVLKNDAKAKLDALVSEGLKKLPSDSLKTSLNTFYQTEIAKIDAVTDASQISTVSAEVLEDTELYIKELVASTLAEAKALMKDYLDKVVSASSVSPYAFIPQSMRPGYSTVSASSLNYDFTNFVNVSTIIYGGFGEQWNMVIENIEESEKINSVLSKGESALTASVTLLKEYLNSKYSDSLSYKIEKEGFIAEINFENENLTYTLTYKSGLSIPLFGEVTPIVSMVYDHTTSEKIVTIKLTETNIVKYVVTDNSYNFEMNYGISKGSRTAYFDISKDKDNKVTGKIYEYIVVAGKTISNSCADFYIDDTYVSAVGNKADGILGLDGYINELYKVSDGKLLGYEVRETKTIAGVSGQYNTLWFNLSDISGITSIKVLDHKDGNDKNNNDIYINGNTKVFNPAYNKKLGVKTSRKFDIELRTQFFYCLNSETQEYEQIEVHIPMMFIQADNDKDTNFSDYTADVLKENSLTSSVTLNETYLDKIEADYATLIDTFIENKETITPDKIKTDLGIVIEK